jgi:hypothetical protein
VEEYKGANDGKFPYMVWSTRRFWLYTDGNVTEEMHDISLAMQHQITDWAEAEVFKRDAETCSRSIFLYFLPPLPPHVYKPDVSREYGCQPSLSEAHTHSLLALMTPSSPISSPAQPALHPTTPTLHGHSILCTQLDWRQ